MAVGRRCDLYGSGGRAAGRAGPGRRALSGPGLREDAPGRLLLPPSRGEGKLRGGEPGAAPAGQQAGSEGNGRGLVWGCRWGRGLAGGCGLWPGLGMWPWRQPRAPAGLWPGAGVWLWP